VIGIWGLDAVRLRNISSLKLLRRDGMNDERHWNLRGIQNEW